MLDLVYNTFIKDVTSVEVAGNREKRTVFSVKVFL